MANFEEAYQLTGHNEGGYDNNPNDHGGETYAGVARRFWPNWSGWAIIDAYKKEHGGVAGINAAMAANAEMSAAKASFYKQNFWDVNKLDMIKDDQLGDAVYDFGVNSGVGQAAKVLQRSAGVPADGIIGAGTLSAINGQDPETIYNAFCKARGEFYGELAKHPGQSQFYPGWMKRIKPYVKQQAA